MRHSIGILVLLGSMASFAFSAEPMLTEKQWKIDGVTRKALAHIPASATQSETPIVFAFHGHGGTMGHAARTFSYHTHWPEAIVVYMQGLETPGRLTDPEGKKAGWQHSLGDQNDRDLKFFDEVFASLKTDYKVDLKRVYSTGHSNGGAFTYLLWANRSDVWTAVAPSAATAGQEAKNLKPKPVLHVAGEKDPLVKWEWQKRTIDGLRKLNSCESEGTAWAKSGDLVGTVYASKTGTPVVTLIHPGDHKFPTEAPALITKFFKEHVKP